MPKKPGSRERKDRDEVVEKLNVVIHLLQDLFILEGVKLKMDKEGLRKVLGIDKKRIGRISKLVKTA